MQVYGTGGKDSLYVQKKDNLQLIFLRSMKQKSHCVTKITEISRKNIMMFFQKISKLSMMEICVSLLYFFNIFQHSIEAYVSVMYWSLRCKTIKYAKKCIGFYVQVHLLSILHTKSRLIFVYLTNFTSKLCSSLTTKFTKIMKMLKILCCIISKI